MYVHVWQLLQITTRFVTNMQLGNNPERNNTEQFYCQHKTPTVNNITCCHLLSSPFKTDLPRKTMKINSPALKTKVLLIWDRWHTSTHCINAWLWRHSDIMPYRNNAHRCATYRARGCKAAQETAHSVATSHSALNQWRLRTVTTADAFTRGLTAH